MREKASRRREQELTASTEKKKFFFFVYIIARRAAASIRDSIAHEILIVIYFPLNVETFFIRQRFQVLAR